MKILGISGSLRSSSHNTRLLARLAEHSETGHRLDLFAKVGDIPVFNEDLECSALPSAVRDLWQAVSESDGLLFATPEYNQALPGSTKNLVDWISRAPAGSLLNAKPVAVVGATVGVWGTRIAQQQLRTVLLTCGARVMPSPSLYLANIERQDVPAALLRTFMRGFATWISSAR